MKVQIELFFIEIFVHIKNLFGIFKKILFFSM